MMGRASAFPFFIGGYLIDISSLKGTAVYFVLLEFLRVIEEQQKRIEQLEQVKSKGRK